MTPHLRESAALGGTFWRSPNKPLHRFVACMGLILGVTGLFLGFFTGPFVPIVAWSVAGMALQICG